VDASQASAGASVLGASVALVTLGVVGYQVRLMWRQTNIMEKQLDLARKQAEIISAQLARHPVPELQCVAPEAGEGRYCVVEFRLWNRGTKGMREFWWHLRVPREAVGLGFGGYRENATVTVGGMV
jgi:hypothetical protein